MSYSNSSRNFNNQPFYSPAKFENDQKDLLISQLKAENFELRQNERDYQELAQHLKSLEHRYNMLHDEKMRNEVEFRNRSDQTLKSVAGLRNENDSLKSQLTEKHIEIQELRAESLAVKEIADHRAQDIQRNKSELQQVTENNRRIYEEKLRQEAEIQTLKDEKRRLIHDQEILNNNYEDLLDKLQETEKQFLQLQGDFEILEKQQTLYKQDMDNANQELKNKNENLKYTRLQYQEAQNYISSLQNDLEELHKQKEKYKQESQLYQKNYQQEADTCMELNAQVIQLDQTNKHQERTLIEQRQEIERLKQLHIETLDQSEELASELDQLRRVNEQLIHQHSEISEELERLAMQEEQQTLLRNNKIKEIKTRLNLGVKSVNQYSSPFKRFSNSKNKKYQN
ncbi:hypothetical protein pb186bvf_000907 [Paramecium bursaria]